MLSLTSHSNIDQSAIITYTIEGLPGSNESKAFMYEAENLSDFKKKLQAYDLMYANKPKTKEEYYKKKNTETTTKKDERRCYNCGEKNSHFSNECPSKDNVLNVMNLATKVHPVPLQKDESR